MNQEKYTERMRGFLQSAQMLALREGHQRFIPDHLLKVLLEEKDGLARSQRGKITILDRDRLETIACECYRTVRDE